MVKLEDGEGDDSGGEDEDNDEAGGGNEIDVGEGPT